MGLEIARRLVGRGYEVAVTDVDEQTTAGAAEAARRARLVPPPRRHRLGACRSAASQVVERSGSLDVWVNNAGILFTGLAYEQDIDVHRRMLEVNAVGTINGTLAAIERMRPAGRGHIINLISLAGLAAATGHRRLLGEQARGDRLQPRYRAPTCAGPASPGSTSPASAPMASGRR